MFACGGNIVHGSSFVTSGIVVWGTFGHRTPMGVLIVSDFPIQNIFLLPIDFIYSMI